MLLPSTPNVKDKAGQTDLMAAAKTILSKYTSPSEDGSLMWQIGKTKIFLKESQVRLSAWMPPKIGFSSYS